MRRWLETQGYVLVWKLALLNWRWLHDAWAGFWYRRYCPHPIIHDLTARGCINAGHCGCDNQDRYSAIPPAERSTPSGE